MRIEQLTFTRFIAAIAIVVFHDGLDIFPFHFPGIQTVFMNAYSGVSYFFILSGFVMVIAYSRKRDTPLRYSTYYINRFARIYPAYFIALMMVVFLFLVTGKPVGAVSFASGLLLLQAWIPGHAVTLNVPGWSLSVELFFYLLFPWLFNFFYRKNDNLLSGAIAVLFIWLGTQAISAVGPGLFSPGPVTKDLFFYHPLIHINEFLVGNIAALYFLKHRDTLQNRNYDVVIILVLVLLTVFILVNPSLNIHNGLLAVFFVPLIVLLSMNNGVLTRFFVRPGMVLLGEISFGIYIYQKPVKYYLYKIYSELGIEQKELCFYGFLAALILFSYFSYRYIETPLRKTIQARFGEKTVSSVSGVKL